MQAELGSGIRFMSDSWIAFQPAIEEPSNMMPSAKVSSSTVEISTVTCCHLPRGSVNRKSQYLTSLSLTIFRTSLAVVIASFPFCKPKQLDPSSDRVHAGFARADANYLFDGGDEYFSVPDPPGLGGSTDRLDGLFDHVVAEHNLDLHLGQKIDDVFRPPVQLGMALLPAEPLGFGHRDALKPDFLQRFLHLVELERLD